MQSTRLMEYMLNYQNSYIPASSLYMLIPLASFSVTISHFPIHSHFCSAMGHIQALHLCWEKSLFSSTKTEYTAVQGVSCRRKRVFSARKFYLFKPGTCLPSHINLNSCTIHSQWQKLVHGQGLQPSDSCHIILFEFPLPELQTTLSLLNQFHLFLAILALLTHSVFIMSRSGSYLFSKFPFVGTHTIPVFHTILLFFLLNEMIRVNLNVTVCLSIHQPSLGFISICNGFRYLCGEYF